MPKRTAYSATIEHIQIMDEHGNIDQALAKAGPMLEDAELATLYDFMILCRQLDEIAFKLQRSGRMGTYPQNKGQEACAIGAAYAGIVGTDYLVPCYRENAALFMHGLPMEKILLHWMGDERGNQIPEGVKMTPLCIPIGTQMLHATGIAWAKKLQGEKAVAFTFFGDGATSEGDFHEAMNFASVYQAPVVFVCQNNGWAISVPRSTQMRSETVAQKALGYGMPTVMCDGNDLLSTYRVAKEAADRARNGGGPSFIEMVTYRLADHTTADDARRYRDAAEVEAWTHRDPMIRLRKYLTSKGLWNDAKQAQSEEKAKAKVSEVVKNAESIIAPDKTDIFDYTFATLPADLELQKQLMRTTSLGLNPDQVGLNA